MCARVLDGVALKQQGCARFLVLKERRVRTKRGTLGSQRHPLEEEDSAIKLHIDPTGMKMSLKDAVKWN